MLKLGDINENHVLTIIASGKLTKADYQEVMPHLEQLLQQHGRLRFLIDLRDLTGFEAKAMWEDLKFDRKHINQYGKTAIVGDSKWEQWGTQISKPFFDAPMRYFDQSQMDEAWQWVNA